MFLNRQSAEKHNFSRIIVSMGYFAYDFIDMSLHTWYKRSTKEMLLHHIAVFTCFGIAAHTKFYVTYAGIALIVEINSICLHARAMLILTGIKLNSVRKLNSLKQLNPLNNL